MSDDQDHGATPADVLREILTSGVGDARQMTVRCSKCRNRLGVVVDSPYEPLWIGELRGRFGRRVRVQWARPGESLVPMWVESWRGSYHCDCECRRNHAQGPLVWAAWCEGRSAVEVPVPPE